jgi:putative salt-induced outer membrane protein YdiY
MRIRNRSALLAGATIATVTAIMASGAATANAQSFTFGKPEDVKEVEWSASAEAGLIVTTGNSETTTFVGAAKAARKEGNNKFEAEATGAFARSEVLIATDLDASGTITANEIDEQDATSTKNAQGKLRYDRFLTEFNSLYVSATAGFDEPAGKDFYGGGQAGYSRQVYKDDRHELKAEVGYDFTYEDLSAGDGTSIHSARVFAGYKGALQTTTDAEGKTEATTTADASVEGLFNVNTLDVPTGDGEAGPFEDTRIIGTAGVSTKLLDNISLAVSFTAKFDNVPAPLAPFALPYADGFVPDADKLDTITKATLIVNFF